MYAAFSDKENAIGLDLIRGLEAVNRKIGKRNFKAIVRLSKPELGEEVLPRWTPEYVEDQLTPYAGDIRKVWVCGPPKVNEMMDRTLHDIAEKLMLIKRHIHIL